MNWLKSIFSLEYHYANVDVDKVQSVDEGINILKTKGNSIHSDTGNALVLKCLQNLNERVKELEKCQKNDQYR